MHKFDHPESEVTFELPEDPTIRQLMAYDGFELAQGRPMYERLWDAARTVIQDWECEILPDIQMSLDEVGSNEQLAVIKWAALACFGWRQTLKEELLPKN